MIWHQTIIARSLDSFSKFLAVGASATLVLPTAILSTWMSLFLLCWLGSGNLRVKIARVAHHPVALSALALVALFLLGILYTSASTEHALKIFGKYGRLLLIPLLLSVFYDSQLRDRAYRVFLGVMIATLLVSYAQLLGLVPLGPPGQEYALVKGRIAHGFFMAVLVYLMATHFIQQPRLRWVWGVLVVLGINNVLFMNSGRTGYMILLGLMVLFTYQQWRWRGLLISVVASTMIAMIGFSASPIFKQRILEMSTDVQKYIQGDAEFTSVGGRMEFYQNSLQLIAKHPLLGGGTGSFKSEYAQLVKQQGVLSTNPHNEYLMVTSELGLVGLAALLMLWIQQWRYSQNLEWPYRHAAQGLVVAMVIGCLFNSFLLNFSEKWFYIYLAALSCAGPVFKKEQSHDAPKISVEAKR